MHLRNGWSVRAARMALATSLAITLAGWGCALEPGDAVDDEAGAGASSLGPSALFEISMEPETQTVGQGEWAYYDVEVAPLEGFEGSVALGLEIGAGWNGLIDLFPTMVTPPESAYLYLYTACETAPGDYSLSLFGSGENGTSATDTATLTVESAATQPGAWFYYDQDGLSFQFYEWSSVHVCDPVVVRQWDFGDGTTSTEQWPVHTYARGEHTVTLTVTTASGLSDTFSQTILALPDPFPLSIVRVSRNPTTFQFSVDLAWSGAEGYLVRLFRNGSEVDVPDNDGAVRDQFRTTLTTDFIWQLCELSFDYCSNTVSLSAGPGATIGDPITVTTVIDGRETVQTLQIEDGSAD